MPDIVCISPVDGREVVRRPASSAAEIEAAVNAAHTAQAEWKRVPVAERASRSTTCYKDSRTDRSRC